MVELQRNVEKMLGRLDIIQYAQWGPLCALHALRDVTNKVRMFIRIVNFIQNIPLVL